MGNEEEKIRFLREHEKEILPVTGDSDALKAIRDHTDLPDSDSQGSSAEKIEGILEQFETKVFLYEKAGALPGSKRVLIEAAEPLAFTLMSPVLARLREDPRCRAICLLTDNISGKKFVDTLGSEFTRIDDHAKPVFSEIPGPFDVAIVGVEPPNSPNSPLLFGAKSVFGANRLYFVVSGWLGVGGTKLFDKDRMRSMEEIDGWFVNDDLAKKILLNRIPSIDEARVYSTGTPVTDGIGHENSEECRREGRKKLGLSDDTHAILYLGDISSAYQDIGYETDSRINEKTFAMTLDAVGRLASREGQKKFAVLYRPHPRDPNKEEFLSIARTRVPENLSVISAEVGTVTIEEAGYAADLVLSIVSTGNFLARLRGRNAVFLGYDEKGLGKIVLSQVYGSDLLEIIKNTNGLSVVSSPDELVKYLTWEVSVAPPKYDTEKPSGDSISKILDKILA